MHSILTKLFSIYSTTTVLLIFVVLYFTFDNIKKSTIDDISVQLDEVNRLTLLQTKSYIRNKEYSKLDSLVKILGRLSNCRVTIILPDGVVSADSDENPAKMENHRNRPEIIDADNHGTGQAIRYSYTLNKEMIYRTIKINHQGRFLGFSRISKPISYLDELYTDIIWRILIISILVFLLSLILFYMFSRNISKNIYRLVDASNNIAKGNFETKVYLNTKDELSILANNFNNMSDKLNKYFEEINEKQQEISSIIKSIKDGFVVIDNNEKIIYSNKNFRKYFNIDKSDNKHYWELITSLDFRRLVKKIQSSKKKKAIEINFNDSFFLASGSWNELKKEVVIIIYDINEFKRLEKVKRDFIVNVSHELKTPLTAIKGFIETMADDVEDDEQKHYLKIIERQTSRLIHIVQDLLLLSSIEKADIQLERKKVNLRTMIDNLFTIFSAKALDKGIELKYNISKDCNIFVDEFMFEQVFVNLIENGLVHTDTGYISISAVEKSNKTIIKISDTGAGIGHEHLTRIFERFYTVDKSRSKSISGTGLGLSIVKHIINLHNAAIDVKSEPGKGTTFIIEI